MISDITIVAFLSYPDVETRSANTSKSNPAHKIYPYLLRNLNINGRTRCGRTKRNIKATLGLGVLSCKTPAMAEKKVWKYLLAYNLIRMIMAQAAIHTQQLPRGLSFNHSADPSILLALIAQQRVGKRPGSVEPRALKRRPKPYPLLNLPRQLARQRVLEHGHPKNLK